MTNIANRTGDQVVSYNDSLIGVVKHTETYQADQAITIPELESEDLRGRGQGDGGEARGNLGGDEGCSIEQWGKPAGDSRGRINYPYAVMNEDILTEILAQRL